MQLDYCILSVVEMQIYKKVRYTYDKTNHKKNFNTLYGTVCFMTTICSQTSVKAANKVYKNVKLIFEDNQGNTIKTFTKDITQGETLGQILGDQYPTMKADSKLGNFTGWYSSDCLYGLYSGKRYEKIHR